MILRRAVQALGADYSQWRVLTGVMLKCDLRSSKALQMGSPQKKGGVKLPWATLVMYAFFGIMIALTVAALIEATGDGSSSLPSVPAVHFSGSVALLLISALIGMIILVEFNSVVVSPDDYQVLAHQPVSSRTYFLVKVTNVLLYTGLMGALMGAPAAILFLFWAGPLLTAAWVLAVAGAVVWTSLTIVCVYAVLVHLIRPQRLRRVLSYVQLLMSFAVFGPMLLMQTSDWMPSVETGPPAALMFLPPTWFASLLPLAAGEGSATTVLAVVAAFGTIGVLVRYAGGRLSLSYAERLGAIASASETRRLPGRAGGVPMRWLSAEQRVIATLVRGQFRHDMNFRMAVLSLLPITVIYVLMGMGDGGLGDPFVELGFAADGLRLIHFAVLGMPLVLMENLFRSESFRASWIFFASPVDRAKLISSTGTCVTILFLVPYLSAVAGMFVWSFGNLWHGVGHALVLGLLAHLIVQLRLLVTPRLAFSQPLRKGSRVGSMMGLMLLAMLAIGLLPLVLWVAYARTEWAIATMVLLAGAGALMPRLVTLRIRPRVERHEFSG